MPNTGIEGGGIVQTTALRIEGKIVMIYVTRNANKLRHLNSVFMQ